MDMDIFPLTPEKHIVFAIFGCVFFILQFVRTRQLYQIIMAAAFPLSLLVYVKPESIVWYYGVGAAVGVLLLAAFIAGLVQGHADKKKQKAEEAAKAAQTAEG